MNKDNYLRLVERRYLPYYALMARSRGRPAARIRPAFWTNIAAVAMSEPRPGSGSESPDLQTPQPPDDYLQGAPSPSLTISRLQTPEWRDDVSLATDLMALDSEEDETGKRRPTLDTDRAVVKRFRPSPDADAPAEAPAQAVAETPAPQPDPTEQQPLDLAPPIVTKRTYKKRVTSKAIDKLWTTLDPAALKSMESLCEISMSKVLERFEGSAAGDATLAQVQRVLAQHWLSTSVGKSFLARLSVTKLPPLASLMVRMKGLPNTDFNPLDLDHINHRKGACEAYLLAEMKQLHSLEAYYNSVQNMYRLDQQYLAEFRKTSAAFQKKAARERANHPLNPAQTPGARPNIKLDKPAPSTSSFDPDTDPDTQGLLREIGTVLDESKINIKDMLALCDKLDVVKRKLYQENT